MTKFTVSQARSSASSVIEVLRNIDIRAEDALVNDFSVLLQNAIDSLEALTFGMDRHIAYTEQQEADKQQVEQQDISKDPRYLQPCSVKLTNRQALALVRAAGADEVDLRILSGNSFLGPFGTKIYFKMKGCSMHQWLSGYAQDSSDIANALSLFDRRDLTAQQVKFVSGRGVCDGLALQDAYHYALCAAGGAVDGVESVFSLDEDSDTHSLASQFSLAMSKANKAGYPFGCLALSNYLSTANSAAVRRNATSLARALAAWGKEHGIDANTGEKLAKLASVAAACCSAV